MSSLSFICEYGSESSSSDSEECNVHLKRNIRLPAPDLSKVQVTFRSELQVDDPEQHDGRTRSFPHIRGNWPSFVYLKYPEEYLEKFIKKIEKRLLSNLWQKCDNIHISVSRTFVLNYHLISPFTSSLQKAVSGLNRFHLNFNSVKIYCNQENTRTFIALQLDHLSQKHLNSLTKKVDEVLSDYKLPIFYKDPSFHMSIFWINGNKKSEVNNYLDELNNIIYCEAENSLKIVEVDKIHCKTGNKYFQYNLQ